MIEVSEAELAVLVGKARVTPVQTSPLAGLQLSPPDRNTLASLASKGMISSGGVIAPHWHAMLLTLADPQLQVLMYLDGVGDGWYFGGQGGLCAFGLSGNGTCRLVDGASAGMVIEDIDSLIHFSDAQEAPPLSVDLSIEELTVVAALADAYRQEQLVACLERRPANPGPFTREAVAYQIATGTSRSDRRWLTSILTRFAAPGGEPKPEHLENGGAALIQRGLARVNDGNLEPGPELQAFCEGFSVVTPFFALAVHAPWDPPAVKVFTRGTQHFWGIEYAHGQAPSWARLSRLHGQAIEGLIRQHLMPMDQFDTRYPEDTEPIDDDLPLAAQEPPPPPPRPAVKAAPPAKTAPPAKAAAAKCAKCGTPLKPGKRFCTKCGTKV